MITHDHKLFFIHIPKCAGRSVCDIFKQRFDHFTGYYYMQEYWHFWAEYRKFTIIRNPLERYVSMYHYITQHRRHKYEEIAKGGESFKSWLILQTNHFRGDFPTGSAEGQRGTDGDLGSSFWFTSQRKRICDYSNNILPELMIFDFSDMPFFPNFLKGITGKDFGLSFENKSEHDHFLKYYDDELLQLISNFRPFEEDNKLYAAIKG